MVRLVCEWVAVFVLHAVWQVPLFTVATWLAMRAGRPTVRAAHAFWVGTLVLCVATPLVSTGCAYSAARAGREDVVLLSFEPSITAGEVPTLHRDPVWKRVLHRHVSLQRGLQPFAFTVPADATRVVAGLYAFVLLLFVTRLFMSWRATRRLVREALPVPEDGEVATALRLACAAMTVAPPKIGVNGKLRGPVLASVVAPTLLLPTGDLSGRELQAVLAHELAHLRRRDPWINAACSLLLLPVCFHPAALWAAFRIRQTREMACDAEAAEIVGSRTGYAHALLQVAERASGGAAGAAPGFFHTGLFFTGLHLFGSSNAMEERMKSITQNSSAVGGGQAMRLAVCAAVASVAALAAAMVQVQPAKAATSPQRVMPFDFAQEPSPSAPFEPVQMDQHAVFAPRLQLAAARKAAKAMQAAPEAKAAPQEYFQVPGGTTVIAHTEALPAPATGTVTTYEEVKTLKISTAVLNGNSLTKVPPVYPPQAKRDRVAGPVVLRILVDSEGKVANLAVLSSPDESLSVAAENAVRQWTYKPYLLNGQPMAVESTVTVTYSLGE